MGKKKGKKPGKGSEAGASDSAVPHEEPKEAPELGASGDVPSLGGNVRGRGRGRAHVQTQEHVRSSESTAGLVPGASGEGDFEGVSLQYPSIGRGGTRGRGKRGGVTRGEGDGLPTQPPVSQTPAAPPGFQTHPQGWQAPVQMPAQQQSTKVWGTRQPQPESSDVQQQGTPPRVAPPAQGRHVVQQQGTPPHVGPPAQGPHVVQQQGTPLRVGPPAQGPHVVQQQGTPPRVGPPAQGPHAVQQQGSPPRMAPPAQGSHVVQHQGTPPRMGPPAQGPHVVQQQGAPPQVAAPVQGSSGPVVPTQQKIRSPGDIEKLTSRTSQMAVSPPSGTGSASHLLIPHRKKLGPIVGVRGRKILIEVNHLQLNLRKTNMIAIHYDVAFKPDLPKKMLRHAMEAFRKKHFPQSYPAFDGRKNLYSCGYLPFKNEIRDTVTVMDEERQRDKEFDIIIKFASQVDMSVLATYTQSGKVLPQEAIQALDIVLRNPAALSFTPVGRSFFTPPKGQVIDLGDGMELWYGFYQSAILGWKPYLNIDVAHKGFPQAKHLIDVVLQANPRRRIEDLNKPLDQWEKQNVEKYVKGLKVEYQILNQPNTKRTYKVNSIKGPCNQEKFKMESGKEMTVAEYFAREKKVALRFPAMPCIHVGSELKTIYLPLEFCKIVAGQVVNTKLNETQTANMVRAAAKPADERKRRIMEAMRQANFNADKCIQEFGITVSQEFTKVGARILDPPRLEYNSEQITPSKGVWRPSKFFRSNGLREWKILNLDQRTREDSLWNFANMMMIIGRRLGIDIAKPLDVKTLNLNRVTKQPIIEYFEKVKSIELVVVIINEREPGIYGKVKQSAELSVGVLTQCIKSRTMMKMSDATCSNILLKINSKLNGVNHQIHLSCRPKVFAKPVMIVGADVTHPSPDQKTIPSVAAVAASHDPSAFQYNMLWRLQPPRQEMIEDLENMIKIQLKYFYKKARCKPEKIIFYRDGVSEGQFSQVLDVELKAIRRACTSLEPSFKPPITFLVVQKRHHTRFFPTNPKDEDGRNKNVPAGTIVDTDITHPREMDFYLVSHASLQGTSRPTKYHKLWDDNDIDEDDLEELTYYLCHLFSRCTRSVSYPAPTYYAHLAAFRARSYIEGAQIAMTNLSNEQRQRTIQSSIVDNRPMFFV